MEEQFWTRHEQEQYIKRMEDEHNRISHRLTEIEKAMTSNNKLLLSVERLAVNMENMQKEQLAQGKRLEAQGEEIEELKGRDGETWRKVKWYVLTAILGIVVGYIFSQIGMS